MTLVFYTKTIGGRVYPKARREGENVAYANDVYRKDGKVVSKYVGILQVPKGVKVEEKE